MFFVPHRITTTHSFPTTPKQQYATKSTPIKDPDATAMPPALLDDMQIANAMRNDALPALERLAGNSSLRDRALSRFERDEPPPYVSSTEDEDEDEDEVVPHVDELNRLLDEPLNDRELDEAAWFLEGQSRAYHPGARYDAEAELERHRVERWARGASNATREYFVQYGPAAKGRAGRERVNIIARRNIRRRWQKLGVWNPEWGIPNRENDPQPSDKAWDWKWPWQHGDAAAEWVGGDPRAMARNLGHPVTRALQLRRGLRWSEHSPVPPRSHLGADASASQAESFITSRPWFMFAVERSEEVERYRRLSTNMRRSYMASKPPKLRDRWEKRGDWKPEWRDRASSNFLIGWKWRHESPSPEPEDLSGLEDLATLELTPSEADALEAVPPPSPPTPRPVYIPPTSPGTGLFGSCPLPPASTGVGINTESPPTALEEAGFDLDPPPTAPAEAEPINQEPPRRRTRQRAAKPSPPQQPLRRSARIAAKTAALAANKMPAPPRTRKSSRVAKPAAQPKGRPRKKRTR